MAQLDFYRQQIQARNANNPNIGGIGRIGAYTERTADIVARSATILSERAEKRAEEDAAIDAASKLAATQREWMVRERDMRQKAMESGEIDDYPQRLMDEYEPWVQEQISTAKTPRARAYLEERLATYGTQLFGAGMQFEADARVARTSQQADSTLEDLRVVLDQDPEQYAQSRETLGLVYAQLPPGPEREKAWQAASAKLAFQAALTEARRAPETVLAALEGGAALRPDGSQKATGFLGELPVPGGSATEYSVQSQAVTVDGKQVDFPTLVPTLTDAERRMMVEDIIPNEKEIPEPIMQKAIAHAKARIAGGKSPFAGSEDGATPIYQSGISYIDDLNADERVRLRSFVEAEVASREVKARQAEAEARAATINGIYDALEANGGDLLSLVQQDPEAFDALDPEEQVKINNFAGGIAMGANRPTDWVQYEEFIENPALLKSVNLGAIREQFNPKQYAELQELQTALMADPQIEQRVQETNTIIGGMLENAGYKKAQGASAAADANPDTKRGKFYSLLRDAVDQEVAVKGRKLTQRETIEIANGLLVDVVVGKNWFGRDTSEDLFMVDVPDADRAVIEEDLRQKRIPATPYNILMLYRTRLQDKAGAQ